MLKNIQMIATTYFLGFIIIWIANQMVIATPNSEFTSILSFAIQVIQFPKDKIDLIIMYFGLDNYLIPICAFFSLKSFYDIFWGTGLEF